MLGLTDKTAKAIVSEHYKHILDNYDEKCGKTKEEFLQEELTKYFNQHVKDEIAANNTSIISRYMNNINRVNYTYETRENYFRQFNKLDSFFSTVGIEPSIEIFITWLKKDKRMEFFVEDSILIGEYKLNHKVLSTIYQSKSLPLLVEAFCILKSPKLTQELNNYMVNNSVKDYFEGIEEKIITRKERARLIEEAQNGNKKSKDELLRNSLKTIARVAYAYSDMGIDFLDLVQEGSIGFLKAIDKYDEEIHGNFDTYASSWVLQSIEKTFATTSDLKYSYWINYKKVRVDKSKRVLFEQLDRQPTEEELADFMNISKEALQEVLNIQYGVLSLEEIKEKELKTEHVEYPEYCEQLEELSDVHVQEHEMMDLLNACLEPREVTIIVHGYGLNGNKILSREEIGKIIGVSRARVNQLEEKAMKRLIKSQLIDKYAMYMDNPERSMDVLNKKRESLTNIKTIYDYYPDKTKEEVDLIISNLEARAQYILTKKYGADLSNPLLKENLTPAEKQEFYYKVLKVMNQHLGKSSSKGNKVLKKESNNI